MRFLISLLFVVTAFSVAEAAPQRVVLKMNNAIYHSGDVIKLKVELRKQHGIKAANKRLMRVVVVAKTPEVGEFDLFINDRGQEKAATGVPVEVTGHWHRYFRRNGPNSFDRFKIANNRPRRKGSWQIRFNNPDRRDEVMVKRVVLILRDGQGGGNQPNVGKSVNACTHKADDFNYGTEVCTANNASVNYIELTGVKTKVKIKSAIVTFRNGSTKSIPEFVGKLKKGMKKTVNLGQGRRVSKITLRTKNAAIPFIDSRGRYTVEFFRY